MLLVAKRQHWQDSRTAFRGMLLVSLYPRSCVL
jgi:hypothetical protein